MSAEYHVSRIKYLTGRVLSLIYGDQKIVLLLSLTEKQLLINANILC